MTNAPAIDTLTTGLSLANARALLEISALAYEHRTIRNETTGTDVLIVTTSEAVIVAFRGTSEIRDWMVDADFFKAQTDFGKVHFGFLKAFASVRAEIAARLEGEVRQVFFTGHSLGGALAQLAAEYFAMRGVMVGGVYTFGSPRLWNKAAAAHYNDLLKAHTFNFVNACDPVPLLPPLLVPVLDGYRDGGTEIFMPQTSYQTDPWIGEEIIDDIMGVSRSWRCGKLAFLPNHFLKAYIPKVNALN